MHRCISFFAPSSSSISALTLQLIVATGVHAFPDRTTSDGEDPCRVLTLADFVEVSGANSNGMVIKLSSRNLRCIPKESIRRVLGRLTMFISAPGSRANHLVQEDLGDVGPIRLVVAQIPSTFILMKWVAQRKACGNRHGEQSVGLDEPTLGFLRELDVKEIALGEANGKVFNC